MTERTGFHSEIVTDVTSQLVQTTGGRRAGSLGGRSMRREQRLFWRRAIVLALNVSTVAMVMAGVALALSAGGWTPAECADCRARRNLARTVF